MVTKNKQEVQRKKRQEVKKAQQKNKHAQEPALARRKPVTPTIKRILIVCEGENTEKSYFESFRFPNIQVKPVGLGNHTVPLVEETLKIKQEEERKGKKYDQVWCVFDKDEYNDFDKAIELAKAYKFKVAYSNQAFEYWLLLHFNDHQGSQFHRNDYGKRLNSYLNPLGANYDYEGCKIIDKKIFEILQSIDPITGKKRQDLAIERAKKIYLSKKEVSPSKAESVTTVYKLIEQIAPKLPKSSCC